MPHIVLLWSFVEEQYFEEAANIFKETLREFKSFKLKLNKFDFFEHSKNTTVFLSPESMPADRLKALQAELELEYPYCCEQSSKSYGGYSPHLTVAQFATKKETQSHIDEWQRSWQTIEWDVDKVFLISRKDDEPFSVKYMVHFGGVVKIPNRVSSEIEMHIFRLLKTFPYMYAFRPLLFQAAKHWKLILGTWIHQVRSLEAVCVNIYCSMAVITTM